MRNAIETKNAPAAIGNYSQAIKAGNTVYLAAQIPLDPATMTLVEGDMFVQATRVFENIKAVAEASGGTMNHIVKLTVYLTDLTDMAAVNEVIAQYFQKPYPARTSTQVAALPKNAILCVEATMNI